MIKHIASFISEGLELGGTLGDVHGELVVGASGDHSRVNHLGHQAGGYLARLMVLLKRLNLHLQFLNHG